MVNALINPTLMANTFGFYQYILKKKRVVQLKYNLQLFITLF